MKRKKGLSSSIYSYNQPAAAGSDSVGSLRGRSNELGWRGSSLAFCYCKPCQDWVAGAQGSDQARALSL